MQKNYASSGQAYQKGPQKRLNDTIFIFFFILYSFQFRVTMHEVNAMLTLLLGYHVQYIF